MLVSGSHFSSSAAEGWDPCGSHNNGWTTGQTNNLGEDFSDVPWRGVAFQVPS